MKLLAVGDIHLGKRPSRLPGELQAQARDLSPVGAYERIIDAACSEGVDIVAFAGDVVEREKDFFEAYRELKKGVSRLTESEITVVGVVGNHDAQVLPRLADEIQDFHLLGLGGNWESFTHHAGSESVVIWGWSFPRQRVTESPLADLRFERLEDGPNLGLMHCDRNQPGSPYGPVADLQLESSGLDGWLLGHIHKPDQLSIDNLSGYLGSITGMDSSEVGARGPWMITIEGGRISGVEQLVLAPLRWESLSVDLSGIVNAVKAKDRLLHNLRELDAELCIDKWIPEAVGLQVNLTGQSRFGKEAQEQFSAEDRAYIFQGERETRYFIDRLDVSTLPEVALETLSEHTDPAGLLASRLLILDRPSDDTERQEMIANARHHLAFLARDTRWSSLQPSALDEEQTVELLRRAGSRLLERLLAQREVE